MRREQLVEWTADHPEGVTIQEVADAFSVHYQTAHLWIKALVQDRLLRRVTAGQPYRFVTTASEEGTHPLVVRHKGEALEVAAWALTSLQNAAIAAMAHSFTYLFIRSYYYDAPDHQHLRGTLTPVEVREKVEELLREAESHLAVVRQLLSLRAPWTEGPNFAMRFGSIGNHFEATLQAAQLFSQVIMKPKDSSLTTREDSASMEGPGDNEGVDHE